MTKPLRIVFLDFDGVLNSLDWIKRRGKRPEPSGSLASLAHGIDPDAVARVNEIVAHGRAQVVISSSWREMTPVKRLRELLEHRGFVGRVIGKTPSLPLPPRIMSAAGKLHAPKGVFRERGDEIAMWLRDRGPVESFVILDDDDDMGKLRPRLVQTDFDHGLLGDHVERALALLEEPCRHAARGSRIASGKLDK